MKWKTPEKRSYYQKYEQVDLKNAQGWFECYKLPGNVYALCEPQHFQEVNAFLIIGRERALLLDTGMGIRNVKAVIEELYPGEVIVANSHFHFDHIGDNWRFDEVIAPEDPYVKKVARSGLAKSSLGNQLDEDMFLFGYPEGFNPNAFRIPPYRIKTAEDGERFDLGGRTLELMRTPGHSGDCIMLYDFSHDILFSGDMFYLGALYVHFDCAEFGRSDLGQYIASIRKVIEKYPHMQAIYSSHNDFLIEAGRLTDLLHALIRVQEKQGAAKLPGSRNHSYLEETQRLAEYNFDGFSIVIKE